MTPPDLTVSFVAYECRDDLLAAIRSVEASLKEISAEVVVADNASTDGVVAALRRDHPEVLVVEMGANSGFARANNRGIAATTGRHVLLLNPDTEVAPGALDELVAFADRTPGAGVVAPKLLNTDLTDQGTARAFPTPAAAIFGRRSPLTRLFPRNRWSRRFMVGRERTGDDPFEVDWVSGAALLVPRRVVEQVGGLDEDFFMHFEDAEWCHRVKSAGYSVWCVPRSRVVHHEGGSRRGWPASQVWHFHHGAYLYWRKAVAPQPWNPLRWLAGAALLLRAAAIIARDRALGRTPRSVPDTPETTR